MTRLRSQRDFVAYLNPDERVANDMDERPLDARTQEQCKIQETKSQRVGWGGVGWGGEVTWGGGETREDGIGRDGGNVCSGRSTRWMIVQLQREVRKFVDGRTVAAASVIGRRHERHRS
jgi:hypothetical protein